MKKVLIVEDDRTQREILSILMGHENYWVKACEDYECAVHALVHGSMPDIVLTDYYLPDGDGMELIRYVRRMPGGDVPLCILMTAGDRTMDTMIRAELAKLNAMLIYKPYEPTNVLAVIGHLSQKPMAGPETPG